MSNPSPIACKLCSKESARKDLVPMKCTTFVFNGKRYNVLETYRSLLKAKKALFSHGDAQICRGCLSIIIRTYVKTLKKPQVCSNCRQLSKILYSKNAIFVIDGQSVALSEVWNFNEYDTLCFPCCSRPLSEFVRNQKLKAAIQPAAPPLVSRPIIIRKVLEQSVPSTSTVTEQVIALNICLHCFKPSTEENIVDMRCMRVTVNDQNVEFVDCFQFCTNRVVDTSSLTKPLICFKCMTTIVKEYEDQHQPVKEEPDIKIEPTDLFEAVDHVPQPTFLDDFEINSELGAEECTTEEPMNQQERGTIENSRILLKNSKISTQFEAHTEQENDLPVCGGESSTVEDPLEGNAPYLNNLDDMLAKLSKVPRRPRTKKQKLPNELVGPVPLQNQREVLIGEQPNSTPIRRSGRVIKKTAGKLQPGEEEPLKKPPKKRQLNPLKSFKSVNDSKLKKIPPNVATIRCRICQVLLSQKQLWIHNELKHSSLLLPVHRASVAITDSKKDRIASAISELNKGFISYGQASELYGIPKSVLYRHHNNKSLKQLGRQPAFDENFEKELAEILKHFDDHQFELNSKDIRKMSYQLAIRNGVPHKYDETEMTGRGWVAGFLSRPAGMEIALRQPGCSLEQFRPFTKEICDKFFDILAELVGLHQLDGSRIYNVDEIRMAAARMRPVREAETKRKRRVVTQRSEENITVLCGVNAVGNWHVKPFLIFKESVMTTVHARGLIEGGRVHGSSSGQMDSDLFVVWLKFFIGTVRPSTTRKVLLLLDGHSTHSKSIAAIKLAEENGVILLQLPAHGSDRLKPLAVSFLRPLVESYEEQIRVWQRINPGKTVTSCRFAGIFSAAYEKLTNCAKVSDEFSNTGIWPINKDIFLNTEFAQTTFSKSNPPELADSFEDTRPEFSQAVEVTTLVPEYSNMIKKNLEAYRTDGSKVDNVLEDMTRILHFKCSQCEPTFETFEDYRQHVLTQHKLVVNDKKLHPWKPESLEKGLHAMQKGLSLRDVQKFYGIPIATMLRYKKQPYPSRSKRYVFTAEEEASMVAAIREYWQHCFDVTGEMVRSLAYQLAEEKQLDHTFSKDIQMAGMGWFHKFRERHPGVMEAGNASLFSDKLQEIIESKHIAPSRIYNVDACSFAEVGKKWQRFYSTKDTVTTSVVTLVAGFNASGAFVTPFHVLQSGRSLPELAESVGQHVESSKTGLFDGEMFHKWLVKFVGETSPAAKREILLILDGQFVNLTSWAYAKSHHVTLLSLPATNYCLQPVDLALFETLETCFLKMVDTWLAENNQKITMLQLSQRLTATYIQTSSRSLALATLRDCGLWPVDKKLIDELTTINYLECPLCLKKAASTGTFVTHMTHKHGICYSRPKCPKCPNRVFAITSQLERHIWLYHSSTFTCPLCATTMERIHFRSHKCTFECHYCRYETKYKYLLVNHFHVCGKPKDTSKPMLTKTTFECHCCAQKFKRKDYLLSHLLLQVKKRESKSLRLRNRYEKGRMMGMHVATIHPRAKNFYLQCAHCSRKFLKKSVLEQHLISRNCRSIPK